MSDEELKVPGSSLNVWRAKTVEVTVPPERYSDTCIAGDQLWGNISFPEEAIEILGRVSMENPPFPISWRFLPGPNFVGIEVVSNLMDRDTGMPIYQRFSLRTELPTTREYLLHWFETSLRAIFMHEFEESFHVDGFRVHDPHQSGRLELHHYNRSGYRK